MKMDATPSSKPPKSFKQVYNAEREFLSNKSGYTIIKTKYKNLTDTPIVEMLKWCKKEVSGSYSVARNDSTDWYLTIRIWDKKALVAFQAKFTNHIVVM